MNLKLLRGLTLILLCLPPLATAETLVLVQGWLGSGDNWRTSGISRVLEDAGWADGGALVLEGPRLEVRGGRPVVGGRRFYTLGLPTTASLQVQELRLARYLNWLQERYPEESIILAGHSAGGVLARYYMVRHPEAPISALITFASPHLGTESATFGADFGAYLSEWLEPYIGTALMAQAFGLFSDLAPARPDNFLGWLNHQPHPSAIYISVVCREGSDYGLGDLLVPARSQDMNHVYALRGRARTVESDGLHGLSRVDGELLVDLLYSMRTAQAVIIRFDRLFESRAVRKA